MITHVVLFKFPARADAERARALLLGMRGRVASLRAIEAGLDVTGSPRSYDLALITRFDDDAGLDAYRTDPLHLEVLEFIRARVETTCAVDYVDDGAPS
ncbi:MAG: Dabb family protein [Nannocystaceae bacterium]